jgi:hypothetical protein
MTDGIRIEVMECPDELAYAIIEFWPESEWSNAASIAKLESALDAFAVADSVDADHPCGALIAYRDGVMVVAELSVGYFQINSCNYPTWEWQRFYNARHNAGTAHALWAERGWSPWYFSANRLGLI